MLRTRTRTVFPVSGFIGSGDAHPPGQLQGEGALKGTVDGVGGGVEKGL